jgi:hypothetical protein
MSTDCRLCGGVAKKIMSGKVLDKYEVCYYDCSTCGYIQTETPFWLEEAYTDVINNMDTGIMGRNYANSKIVLLLYILYFKKIYGEGFTVLDYAGGYGILVRLLRDLGVNAYWDDKFCTNILAKGFVLNFGAKPSMLTAFEVLEHFADPSNDLENLFNISDNILCSTLLISDSPPNINEWWYYGANHGQHIGFFRRATLEYIAQKNGVNLVSDGRSFHLFYKDASLKFRLFKLLSVISRISFNGIIYKLLKFRLL